MTADEAMDAVGRGEVVARDGQGGVYGRGKVIAYSMVPTVTILRDDGTRFDWRHDMVEAAPSDPNHCAACDRCGGVPVS